MKKFATLFAILALSAVPVCLAAQAAHPAPAPKHFFRLKLVVEQVNGAGTITNTRSYLTTIATDSAPQTIKTGSRIPILTADPGSKSSPASTQFQYIDLGVDFTLRDVEESAGNLGLNLRVVMSSIVSQTQLGGVSEPVIRQNVWDSMVTVPIGKPTIVFSSDDLDSKGKMQVEVTATRVE